MKNQNILGDIKSKSIKEAREEINEILKKLESNDVDLTSSIKDYQRLIETMSGCDFHKQTRSRLHCLSHMLIATITSTLVFFDRMLRWYSGLGLFFQKGSNDSMSELYDFIMHVFHNIFPIDQDSQERPDKEAAGPR